MLPEVPFDKAAFLAKTSAAVQRAGYCVVVASEGARYADGRFLADAGATDAFGHAQLGGVAPVLAATDAEQAYAVGRHAVQLALAGRNAVMATIVRESDAPYRWALGDAPLEQVANVERPLPAEFIAADGFGITDAARRYLLPAALDRRRELSGLPRRPARLRRVAQRIRAEASAAVRRVTHAGGCSPDSRDKSGFRRWRISASRVDCCSTAGSATPDSTNSQE